MNYFIFTIELIFQINTQCVYLENINNIDESINYLNYSIDLNLKDSILHGENNIGFGVWIKYSPFKSQTSEQFTNSSTRLFFRNDQSLKRKKEQFVFSMMQKSFQTSQILMSFNFNETLNLFQYKIYIDFKTISLNLNFDFDSKEIQGQWFIFYLYFDQIKNKTFISFYNQKQKHWKTQEILDVPYFSNQVQFHLGGKQKIIKESSQQLYIYDDFCGIFTTIFTTYEYNLIENSLGSCDEQLQFIYPCNGMQQFISDTMNYFSGDLYIYSIVKYANIKSFIINGWVKLDQLKVKDKVTLILRVTFIKNYKNDENIGDRLIYIEYIQNQIPELNGIVMSIQTQNFPQLKKYQTQQQSDVIENFDMKYLTLFTKWHILQFESGTKSNNGNPVISIFFPGLFQESFYWNSKIDYLSEPTLYFFLGGDKFSKDLINGYLTNFYYQEICDEIEITVQSDCHFSCETCDGPSINSCLTCPQGSFREYDEESQSCQCPDNYYDFFMRDCILFSDLGIQAIGNITGCLIGYFEINNLCYLCPYYQVFINKTQILCGDCYIDSNIFSQTLTCTYDMISYEYNQDYVYQKQIKNIDQYELYKLDKLLNRLVKLEIQQFNEKHSGSKNQTQLQCNDGYYLSNNQCLQCGQYCKKCNSLGLCNYCLDSQEYFLSFDGRNCQRCYIKNCIYCFQYYYQQNIIYSTLNTNFQVYNLEFHQIQDGCALCQENYFFNFQTNQCQSKCLNFINQIDQQFCLETFSDCQFGVIDLFDNNIQCINSINSMNAIINQDCSQISNCKQCTIIKTQLEMQKCILCKKGYYVEYQSNQCIPCPKECISCFLQNEQYQDYWKQYIYGFYSLIQKFNVNNIEISNTKQEIICKECIQGYVFYQNQCIKDCDISCKQCIIEQGISKCIQCQNKFRGIIRSINQNYECIECPNGCQACMERNLEEIREYNPYFILTQDNIKYTRKCYQVFKDMDNQNQLYIDPKNMLVIQCLDYNICMNHLQFTKDFYCTFNDFDYNRMDVTSIILNLFRTNFYFYDDVTQEILFKLSTQKIDIYINFIQNDDLGCVIKNHNEIDTSIQSEIFSLNQVNLHLNGSNSNTVLQFQGQFNIYNFSSVTFSNFQIQFQSSKDNPLNQYQIFISSMNAYMQLEFHNITFTGIDSDFELIIELSFIVDKPFNLIMKNVSFTNIRISNSIIFNSILTSYTILNLLLENIIMEQTIFKNTTFFKLIDSNIYQQYNMNCIQLYIKNSEFENSSMFYIDSSFQYKISSIYIEQLNIKNSNFLSFIMFWIPSNIEFTINYVEIQNTSFQQNTHFICSQNLNASNFLLESIININSTFLFNKINGSDVNNYSTLINQLTFININTDNEKSFIHFQRSDEFSRFNLVFQNIILNQIFSNSNNLQSSFIYLECNICFICNLQAIRNFGVVEIKLFNTSVIQLVDIQIYQSNLNAQKILHPSFECAQQQLKNYVTFLIISFYKHIVIDQFKVKNCNLLNHALISLIGYDEKQQNIQESIYIKNTIFRDNLLIIQKPNIKLSILHIESNQQSIIKFSNVQFDGNILNNYIQSLNLYSSTTILLNVQKGFIDIQDCLFIRNLALNTTNSILLISAFNTKFVNTVFESNNIFINSSIQNRLFIKKITLNILRTEFPILSLGGIGYLIQNTLFFSNIQVSNSYSNNGGCFYIKTNGDGYIHIENSTFQNTSTSFINISNSKGGCFYIDSAQSNLDFRLINSTIVNTFSLQQGGTFYIIPSKSQNKISFININIMDTFSDMESFLSFKSNYVSKTITQVILENMKFVQTKKGFEQFLQKFENFQTYNNIYSMIYINYANITIQNITLSNSFLQQFIQIEQGNVIKIFDLQIVNSTYIKSGLIYISLNQYENSQIVIERLIISNIQIHKEDVSANCTQQFQNIQSYNETIICPNPQNFNIKMQIFQIDTIELNKSLIDCIKMNIFNQKYKINSLIQLELLGQNNLIIIQNSKFNQIICEFCEYGIINILFSIYTPEKLEFKDLIMKDNICGNHGCLSIYSEILENNNPLRLLKKDEQFNFIENYKIQLNQEYLLLERCKFISNYAKLGGALYLNSISCLIIDCLFYKNQAISGGSIYFTSNNKQLLLINTQIINNNALIGGGIFMQQQVLEYNKHLNVYIIDNNATKQNQDISENPTSLTISFDEGKTLLNKILVENSTSDIIQKIDIKPYYILGSKQKVNYIMLPSGIPINQYSYFDQFNLKHTHYNLSFRIIALNQLNLPEKQLKDTFCTLKHSIFEISSQKQINDIDSQISLSNITFNDTSQDYNLDNLIIYFNPQQSQNYFLRLIIECNIIFIPIINFNQNMLNLNYNKQYQLFVDIQTFYCQIGEYLNVDTDGCIRCDPEKNQYSLTNSSNHCNYKDDIQIDKFTQSTIQLKSYYWRVENNSSIIEYCYHLKDNCQGGWIAGDSSCIIGHIGALCEQCDIYQIRGQGAYSTNSLYKCSNCNQIVKNSLIIIQISIWVIFSIFLSVNSTEQNLDKLIVTLRLRCLGLNDSFQKNQTSVLVKHFINYMQIITIIKYLEFPIPDILIDIYNGLANPISQMQQSWDCFIIYFTNIDINYFRIIWYLIEGLMFYNIFILYQYCRQYFLKVKFHNSQLYYALFYLFIYFHPSIITNLMSQMIYRKISDQRWIQGNVSLDYDSNKHQLWLLSLIIPLLLIFGIILPLQLLLSIYRQRNNLIKLSVKNKFGYLFQEYKQKFYFWDILKIFTRTIIIVIFSYYEDIVPVKSSLVVSILFFYSLLGQSFQPFKSKKLNEIEFSSIRVCIISIIFGSCINYIHQSNLIGITFIFYIPIIFLNIKQFLIYFLKLFQAIFRKFYTNINELSKYCPKSVIQHSSFQQYLQKNIEKKLKISKYFQKIRSTILPKTKSYISYKSQLQISQLSSPQIEYFHNYTQRNRQQSSLKLIVIEQCPNKI